MSDRSYHLDLPYLHPTQAQKHVTHNEALQQLDAVVQLAVLGFEATSPPGAPAVGDRYALGAGATGDWAGQDGMIAQWSPPAWLFIAPQEGWQAWGQNEAALRVFTSGSWQVPPVSLLGINTAADATNRLASAADATLLTHEGAGHQLKINKAGSADTASLLFQSSWSGHAEMGLAGNNNWGLKVSSDGSSWTEALQIDATTGLASGAAIQASPEDTTTGRLMRADYGYGPGNVVGDVSQSAGVPSGALIEQGSNSDGAFIKYADGTQICWASRSFADVDITAASGGAYRSELFAVDFPMAFTAAPTLTLSGSRQDGNWDVWTISSSVTASQFNGLHMKLTSDSSQSRSVDYIALGRWF